jgi:predicted metalloprotease with PDZ domain
MLLRPARPGAATFGRVEIAEAGGAITLVSGTLVGEPLYEAGLDAGDRILSIDGLASGATSLAAVAAGHGPGDTVPIRWESRGQVLEGAVVLAEDPSVEVVLFEAVGRPITEEIRAFRSEWLASRGAG